MSEYTKTTGKGLILVCDDNGRRATGWASTINAIADVAHRYEVQPLSQKEFAAGFYALRERRRSSRSGARPSQSSDTDAEIFDRADIVIVDFDLTPTDESEAVAGEDTEGGEPEWVRELSGSFGNVFCYLLRCYSTAGFTVLVNQDFPKSTFDLTMRRFDFSDADLDIAAPDLGNESLWTGTPSAGEQQTFRPWHWPRLLDAPDHARRLASKVDLDDDVFSTLGLAEPDVFSQLHVEQLEVLGLEDREPVELSFRTLARETRFGLLESDELSDHGLRKVAASAATHWLDRFVLRGQNVVVDAPHLVQRLPGLATLSTEDWDTYADLADPDRVRSSLDGDALGDAEAVATSEWLARPTWLWPRVPRTATRLGEDFPVFCEDISRFCPFDDTSEFISSVPGPLRQRFVREIEGDGSGLAVAYDPQLRLL